MPITKLKHRLSKQFPLIVSRLQSVLAAKKTSSNLPVRPFGPGQPREIQLELEFPRCHGRITAPW